MNEESLAPDDALLPLLVAFDESLASGRDTPPAPPPDLQTPFEDARSVLLLLEKAWPRRGPADTTVDLPAARAAAPAAPVPPPSRMGRFEILRELGRGGFGVVFLARDPELGRRVALKTPRWDRWLTPELRRRFLHEGRAAASLEHPNIVPVHEAGEEGSLCYIASAYCEGPTLAAWLRRRTRPVPCRTAAALAADLAAGVRHAHERGVLHRDLKPSNILLQGADEAASDAAALTPRICDFGLAKLQETDGSDTPSGAVMGTPAYMAPEQAEGRVHEVGPAADVYALGVVLYEILTGRPPFAGESHVETLRLVCSAPPPPPRRRRKDVPRDLQAIILTCLEKDPARRYASAAALETDLRRWLEGKAPLGRPESWFRRAGRLVRRRPALTAAILLLAAAAAAAAVMSPYLDPNRPAKEATARLAEGKKITLIDEKGQPAWWRWRTGGGRATLKTDPDGVCRIDTWDFTLVELLPDTGRDSYLFRAQVRQEKNDHFGEVGLYIAGRDYPTPKGPVHAFVQLTYDDMQSPAGEPPPGDGLPEGLRAVVQIPRLNSVFLHPRLRSELKGAADWDACGAGRTPEMFTPAGRAGGLWRDLAFEVTPAGVRGYWGNGQAVGQSLSGAELVQSAADALDRMHALRPDDPTIGAAGPQFNHRGGLGLYIHAGSASFRNAVVEPLD